MAQLCSGRAFGPECLSIELSVTVVFGRKNKLKRLEYDPWIFTHFLQFVFKHPSPPYFPRTPHPSTSTSQTTLISHARRSPTRRYVYFLGNTDYSWTLLCFWQIVLSWTLVKDIDTTLSRASLISTRILTTPTEGNSTSLNHNHWCLVQVWRRLQRRFCATRITGKVLP